MDKSLPPRALLLELWSDRENLIQWFSQSSPFIHFNLQSFAQPNIREHDEAFFLLVDHSMEEKLGSMELERCLHHTRSQKMALKIGFLTSYGKEQRARELYSKRLIDFYLTTPCHSHVLFSEILMNLAGKDSMNVFLDRLLSQALDEGRSSLAETIASYRRSLQTKE